MNSALHGYYLTATLPPLKLGEPPPLASSELPALWANLLSSEELADVKLFVQGRECEGRSAIAQKWCAVETQLRNAVARVRAGQLGEDVRAHLRVHRGFDVWVERAVTDAFARPDPRQRELALDRFRWERLEEMGRAGRFGLAELLAYALRLRLVERWAGLVPEAGRIRFEKWLEVVAGGESYSER